MNCLLCGTEFVPVNAMSRYCSRECYKRAKNEREKKRYRDNFGLKKVLVKNCLLCGKEFETTRVKKVYCCETCRNLAEAKRLSASKSVEIHTRKLAIAKQKLERYAPQ